MEYNSLEDSIENVLSFFGGDFVKKKNKKKKQPKHNHKFVSQWSNASTARSTTFSISQELISTWKVQLNINNSWRLWNSIWNKAIIFLDQY